MCFQSGSSRCSVGAGGCAEHPGTSSWLRLKMFFLEAGSYVLPRRNENRAPKSSLGVRWELCWAVASRRALPGRKRRWGNAGKVDPGRELSGIEQRHISSPWPRGSLVALPSLG